MRLWWVLLLGCSPARSLVVEIDAEAEMRHRLTALDISLLETDGTLSVPLTGEGPNCLPISFGVTDETGVDDVSIEILGTLRAPPKFRQTFRSSFVDGTGLLPITLEDSCAEEVLCPDATIAAQAMDREDLERRVNGRSCFVTPDIEGCLADRGCYTTSDPDVPHCVPCMPPPPVEPPAPPAPPARAVLPVPVCPDGWLEADGFGCEPWSAAGFLECPAGEIARFGETACVPLGEACPAGEWPPPRANAFYVRAGGAPGDGTEANPFGSLAEAMASVPDGSLLLLGVGDHQAGLTIDRPMTLIGTCPAMTRLDAPGQTALTITDRATLMEVGFDGVDVALRVTATGSVTARSVAAQNVTRALDVEGHLTIDGLVVRDFSGPAVDVLPGGHAVVEDLQAYRGNARGLRAVDGHLVLSSFMLRALVDGPAIDLADGAVANVDVGVLEDVARYGIHVRNATVSAQDVLIRRVVASPDDVGGLGVRVREGGDADLSRVAVRGGRFNGIYLTDSSITGRDLLVEDILKAANGAGGEGFRVFGSGVDVRRLLVRNTIRNGVRIERLSTAVMEDVTVLDTQADADGSVGRGLLVEGPTDLTFARGVFERNRRAGVHIADRGSRATLDDLIVMDTLEERSSRRRGRGMEIDAGNRVDAKRVAITRCLDDGILLTSSSSTISVVTLTDVHVDQTDIASAASSEDDGWGLRVGTSAGHRLVDVKVERGLFTQNRFSGVYALTGDLELIDVESNRNRSSVATGLGGYGLYAASGSQVVATRLRILESVDQGILVNDRGTFVDLQHLEIRDSKNPPSTPGPNLGGGGITVGQESSARIETFRILDNDAAGVRISTDAGADLLNGIISGHGVGVLLQVPDFNQQRLTVGVLFEDNDVNILTGE